MLWIPGPTHVRPELLEELQRPMIGHRSKAMVELIESLDPGLRLAFGLEDGSSSQVAVGTHSATAAMESALHGVGPRVLCVVNGAFSKRWLAIARTLGKEATELEVPWGEAVTREALEEALASARFDALTLVLNETSTGVLTPLADVAAALRTSPDTRLLVDAVSAIAGVPLDVDRNGIDFVLAGVNKALALPPGITVMCASERYLDHARTLERPTWYLDPVRTFDGHAARKTPTTPSIGLFRALARQLEDITTGATLPDTGVAAGAAAWEARYRKHERMKARTLAWARAHDLEPFPTAARSSPTVSCLRAGPIDVAALIAALKDRGHEIGNGYGPLKGETFRIGHMGDHTEDSLESLLTAADEALAT